LPWAKLHAASAVQRPAVQPPTARVRGLRSVPAGLRPSDALASDGGGSGDLARSLELLKNLSSTAVEGAALLTFREATDFADNVEEISRAAEYLQVVAAGAVDRTRRQAAASVGARGSGSGRAVGWTAGWGTETAADPDAPDSSFPRPGAKPTTSPTGHTAEPPAQTTEPCSAPITTT
jgi:hypothetical protein